jgi:hypothetical protein
MFCPDCQADLDNVPVGKSCPSCGGSRREAVVQAGVALSAVATLTATASVGYNPQRPWQQKWRDVLHGLDVLRETYGQNDLDNEVVRRQVEDFFKDCRELADWLRQSANRPEAMDYVHADPNLELCDGMAQTTKHHTRKPNPNSDPITARIAWVHGGHVRGEIEWSSQNGAKGTEDALDLAERCVAAWESFFRRYRLNPAG